MTFVIITAGIDLSVGSVLAFSGIVLASALQVGASFPVAILVGLFVGLLTGSVNGLLITYGWLPPFIATLGMMSIARGGARLITGSRPISGFSESFDGSYHDKKTRIKKNPPTTAQPPTKITLPTVSP